MTAQSMVTIAAPLPTDSIDRALGLIRAMGNPASPAVAGELDRLDGDSGIHFTSLHAIAPTDPLSRQGHLVFELSADGSIDGAVKFVVSRIGGPLAEVFALSSDKPGDDLVGYLKSHVLTFGAGWFGRTGLPFSGTPGFSVGRIRKEAALGVRIATALEGEPGGVAALDRMNRVRAAIRNDPQFSWALEDPHLPPPPKGLSGLGLIVSLVIDFAKTFLWPLLLPLVVVAAFGIASGVHALGGGWGASLGSVTWRLLMLAGSLFSWLVVVSLAFTIPLAAVALALYFSLRAKERTDPLETRAPRRDVLHQMLAGENHYVQNHMVSVTRRKPGLTRRITTRLAFWVIGAVTVRSAKPDHLGAIGTIHFARWAMLPGGRDFIFFSNFGGSWESYLRDLSPRPTPG